MRQREPSRVQMETLGIRNRRQQRLLAAILAVTQDRAADRRTMHAQLMRPAGARPERQQRRALARPIEHLKVRQRLLAFLVIDLHELAVAANAGSLGEWQVDGALAPRRRPDDDCPIELLGLPIAKRLAQTLGGLPGAGNQQ